VAFEYFVVPSEAADQTIQTLTNGSNLTTSVISNQQVGLTDFALSSRKVGWPLICRVL